MKLYPLLILSIFFTSSFAEKYKDFSIEHARFTHTEALEDRYLITRGGELSRYMWLNMSEFWSHSVISRGSDVRQLPSEHYSWLPNFVTKTKIGEYSLEEYVHTAPVDGIIIIHKGNIVYESYPRMHQHDRHLWMSVSKVVPSTCVAILVDRGLISESSPIEVYLPELKGSDWEGIKIIDILDMASGINCFRIPRKGQPNPDGSFARLEDAYGWPELEYAQIDLTPTLRSLNSHRPSGQRYEYANVNTLILTLLVERVANKRLTNFIEQELWQKMGAASDGLMLNGAFARPAPWLGMNSTLRDLGLFGVLFTPSGRKEEVNVISDRYLSQIQTGGRPELLDSDNQFVLNGVKPVHVTYQWDTVIEDGDFLKTGFGGQGLYISPSRDLVIAFFGTMDEDKIYHELHAVCRQLVDSKLFD